MLPVTLSISKPTLFFLFIPHIYVVHRHSLSFALNHELAKRRLTKRHSVRECECVIYRACEERESVCVCACVGGFEDADKDVDISNCRHD